ncbi:MAG TPA: galactose oxidase-like domain-containing protein, partial [Acidimicrobiia bacterium]|nr:galactose oxidase-like domain-containing protein [Acidimicrobiia bacterium]
VSGLPGVAGVPGRPGDGLVGSAWGAAGGPGQAPTAPPDDPEANDGDMFCADVASLPDGRLLIAGGADWYNEPGLDSERLPVPVGVPESEGLRATRVFDPVTGSFQQAGRMKFNRWYPSLVTLPSGKVLVAGGATKRVKNTQGSGVRRTETFDPATNAWTENYSSLASETSLPLSPRLHLMPNGRVLYTGAGQSLAPGGAAADQALFSMLQFFDPVSEKWEVVGPHLVGARDGAASVMLPIDPPYERADVLTFGGTLGAAPGTEVATPLSTLTHVDRYGRVQEELTRFTMLEGRWWPSAVGLPDGTVLAVGGASTSDATAPGTGLAVRSAELYDPRTESWFQMARVGRDRTYHHSAVLLPDGRVLLGGHAPEGALFGPGADLGGPFPNNERDPSFEIFSPHYLFRGPRPVIRHVQAGIRWDETFRVNTRQALSVESVVLIRLPSPEHIIDSDARTVRLAFTRRSNGLDVVAPPDGTIAPPGYYYLFINQSTRRGIIPSMARVVRIGDTSNPAEAIQPYADDDRVPEGTAHGDEASSPTAPVEERLEGVLGKPVADPAPAPESGVPDAGAVVEDPAALAAVPASPAPDQPAFPSILAAAGRRVDTLPATALAPLGVLTLATGIRRRMRRR